MTSLKLLLKFKMEHDYVNEMNANDECYLVEITLIEELLENIDQFWKSWVSFFKVFDELCSTQTIGHVETDVHLDTSHVISQFDDRNL